jgi:hypothetical protein
MPNQQRALVAIPAPERSLFLGTVKLAQQVGADPATNGTRIVSTTIRRSNPQGEPLSVGEWSRQTIVQNSNWLVKIAKRDKDLSKNGSGVVRITFGNGYDALVAIDCEGFPQEINEINKVGIAVCVSTVDDDDDVTRLKYRGVVNPSDSIFEHLQASVEGGRHEQDIRIYIHTDADPWTTLDESIERTEIYRVKTNRNDPFSMGHMEHMVLLEEQLQATGKVGRLEGGMKPAAKTASPKKTPATEKKAAPTVKPANIKKVPATASEAPPAVAKKTPAATATKAAPSATVAQDKPDEDSKDRFEFTPKEYILLSKAFHGKLSKNDITANDLKFTDKEVGKAERICKTAKSALKKDTSKKRKIGDDSNEKATAQSEAPKKSRKKKGSITNTDNDKAAKEPTMTNKKPASEESQLDSTSTKKTPKGKSAAQPITEKAKDSEKSSTPVKKAASKKSTKAALKPSTTAEKTVSKELEKAAVPKKNGPKKKVTPKDIEEPKIPAKETGKIEAPKEEASKKKETTSGIDEPKSPTKETTRIDSPKKNSPRKKGTTTGTETQSPTKEASKSPTKKTKKVDAPESPTKDTQKVDVPNSPTKETQKVKTPERKKRSTRSTAHAEEPKSPADTEATETDAAETPKKQKPKKKSKDATPSAVETGPKGTIKKVAPEGKDQVETPVKRKSRKRKSTTL